MSELIRGVDLEETVYDALAPLFAKGIFRKKIKEKTKNKIDRVNNISVEFDGFKDNGSRLQKQLVAERERMLRNELGV